MTVSAIYETIYETIQEIEAAGENPDDQKTWDRYAEKRQPMKIWRICFMDKKGAYRERVYTDVGKLAKVCAKLGCEATIKDAQGTVIGEVRDTRDTLERMPGNRRWAWYFDAQNECDIVSHFTV